MEEKNSWRHDFGGGEMGVFLGIDNGNPLNSSARFWGFDSSFLSQILRKFYVNNGRKEYLRIGFWWLRDGCFFRGCEFTANFASKIEEKRSRGHDFGSAEMGVFRGSEPKILRSPPREFGATSLYLSLKFIANFTSKMEEKNSRGHDFGSVEMGVFWGTEPKILRSPPREFEATTL